ncbi:hypothetical protein D3C77_651660 [compost metagenome]
MRLRGDTLSFQPCLPADWNGFTLRYRHGGTTYTVTAVRGGMPGDVDDGGDVGDVGDLGRVLVDGVVQDDGIIHLQDDGRDRAVTLELPGIVATA